MTWWSNHSKSVQPSPEERKSKTTPDVLFLFSLWIFTTTHWTILLYQKLPSRPNKNGGKKTGLSCGCWRSSFHDMFPQGKQFFHPSMGPYIYPRLVDFGLKFVGKYPIQNQFWDRNCKSEGQRRPREKRGKRWQKNWFFFLMMFQSGSKELPW